MVWRVVRDCGGLLGEVGVRRDFFGVGWPSGDGAVDGAGVGFADAGFAGSGWRR